MNWFVASLVLSVALTIALNVAIRLFPGAGAGLGRAIERAAAPRDEDAAGGSRVRVVFPWKAMLLASLLLTIVVNLVLRLR